MALVEELRLLVVRQRLADAAKELLGGYVPHSYTTSRPFKNHPKD